MVYTDPASGKTATINYKEMQINITNAESFDKVLVYLIPKKLSSFQRVGQKGNLFTENLNMLLQYDAVVLAYKGTQQYFLKQSSIKPQLYNFTLTSLTNTDLQTALKDYPLGQKTDFINEAAYQLFEQKEGLRMLHLEYERSLQRKVMSVIFACYSTQIIGSDFIYADSELIKSDSISKK